jgi:hypothetical protein
MLRAIRWLMAVNLTRLAFRLVRNDISAQTLRAFMNLAQTWRDDHGADIASGGDASDPHLHKNKRMLDRA